MSEIYNGLLITHNVTKNKTQITKEAIEKLISEQPKVPVTISFSGKPIGFTKDFSVNETGVACRFEISIDDLDQLGVYVVPGFTVHTSDMENVDGVTVINKMTLTSVALTHFPADEKVTKIEKEYT